MNFTIKQNDTLPSLEVQLIGTDGNPINLDMCGVKFHMRDVGGRKEIIKQATIVDAAQGEVKVGWKPGETDIVGLYKCEFEITFTDDSILTVPNDGYFMAYIVSELG